MCPLEIIRYGGRSYRKKNTGPVLGFGGKILQRCLTSQAAVVYFREGPTRPVFPLLDNMCSM